MKQLYLVDYIAGIEYDLTKMMKSKIDEGKEPQITLGRRSSQKPTDITVGRGIDEKEDSDLSKSLLAVSRQHAVIKFQKNEFRLYSNHITINSRYSEDSEHKELTTPEVPSYVLMNNDKIMLSNWPYGPLIISEKRMSDQN